MTRDEAITRLREIQREIERLAREASDCIGATGITRGNVRIRAEAGWMSDIIRNLHNHHGYLGRKPLTMEETITELERFDGGPPSTGETT